MRATKEMNTNKGITLIALVITIIVMLILVGVTISMAVNGGLFDYAGKAVGDTNNAIKAEQELSNGKIQVDGKWYASIDDYLEGKVLVELPEGPKVGDYVNYTPTAGTYTVSSTITGYTTTTEQSYATETGEAALKWRVLSIDEENGTVELVAATAAQTTAKLYLKGADGYNHAVDILNDLCKALYSNTNGATARSIKVEDINAKTTYDYTTYTNYGTVYTPTDKKYPNIYAAEEGSTAVGLNGTGLKGSEGVRKADGTADYTTYTGSSTAETLNATETFYKYNAEDYLNTNLGVNTAPVGLINVGTTYWLASRCVSASSSSATFGVRNLYYDGFVNYGSVFYAGGFTSSPSYAVRPVVSLGSNVTLTKDTTNSTDTTVYWNIEY